MGQPTSALAFHALLRPGLFRWDSASPDSLPSGSWPGGHLQIIVPWYVPLPCPPEVKHGSYIWQKIIYLNNIVTRSSVTVRQFAAVNMCRKSCTLNMAYIVPKQEETGMANLYNLHKSSALHFLSTTVTAITIAMIPNMASACACGCGVFNLGLPGLPSTFYKTKISLQYDYMNQNETQHGSGLVSGNLSPDKQIETNFFNLNIQHMFNHQWGIIRAMSMSSLSS